MKFQIQRRTATTLFVTSALISGLTPLAPAQTSATQEPTLLTAAWAQTLEFSGFGLATEPATADSAGKFLLVRNHSLPDKDLFIPAVLRSAKASNLLGKELETELLAAVRWSAEKALVSSDPVSPFTPLDSSEEETPAALSGVAAECSAGHPVPICADRGTFREDSCPHPVVSCHEKENRP